MDLFATQRVSDTVSTPILIVGESGTRPFKPLTDADIFPFGTHKGKIMEKVPAGYLD